LPTASITTSKIGPCVVRSFHLWVFPVLIGSGKRLFAEGRDWGDQLTRRRHRTQETAMPHAVVGLILVAHGLITTMIGFGSVTSPNAAAMPVPSWFNWWPGPFGRSWLFDALNLGPGLAAVGGLIWLVAGLTLIGAASAGWAFPVLSDHWQVLAFVGGALGLVALGLYFQLGYKTLSTKENSLVDLFVLIAVAQSFALPASIVVYNLDPLYLPVVFAATNGGHFLPYSWLHRTRAYVLLALVASFGPFAILVAGGAEVSFRTSGLLVGVVMVISAFYVRRSAERRIAVSAAPAVGSVPA
jgi:hypothetical protein